MKRSITPCILIVGFLIVGGCGKPAAPQPQVRPVRTVVIQHVATPESLTLTGQIQAQRQINLAFRVGGRLVERTVSVGDKVVPRQIVARLDTADARNALLSARADLAAATSALRVARNNEARQKTLLNRNFISDAVYDQAAQQLQTAQAQVDSAQARLQTAENNLGYTQLRSDVAGTVIAKAAEPGEVVQAGQTVLQLAEQGGKDALFSVPALLIRRAPKDISVLVTLTDDPGITAVGHVREVSPQADPATGTYSVKIGLANPPETMRLGATVTGRVETTGMSGVALPGTALTQSDGKPAVWVVDPSIRKVALRTVTVLRSDADTVIVSDGLKDGDVVVTAGVQALRPGQEVRLLGPSP